MSPVLCSESPIHSFLFRTNYIPKLDLIHREYLKDSYLNLLFTIPLSHHGWIPCCRVTIFYITDFLLTVLKSLVFHLFLPEQFSSKFECNLFYMLPWSLSYIGHVLIEVWNSPLKLNVDCWVDLITRKVVTELRSE